MTSARDAYGSLGQAIRAGDFQGAQNALATAQGRQSIDQSLLSVNQANTDAANQNAQFNATSGNTMRTQQGTLDAARNLDNAQLAQLQAFQQGDYTMQSQAANQAAVNARRDQQGALDQQRNQFNTGNALTLQSQQGTLDAERAAANANLTQQQQFTQGNLTQNNNQFNAGQRQTQATNQAQLNQQTNQFNAGQTNQVVQQGLDRVTGVRQGNQQLAAATGVQDDALWGQAATFGQTANENNTSNAIRGQEAAMDYYGHALDREANRQAGAATVAAQRAQIQAQQTGAIVGAGGAILGGLIANKPGAAAGQALGSAAGQAAAPLVTNPNSDERMKNVRGASAPADFSGVKDYSYTYKPEHQSKPGSNGLLNVGPMADDLPEDVIRRDKDGYKFVDLGRLAMRQVAAIGELQRQQAQR